MLPLLLVWSCMAQGATLYQDATAPRWVLERIASVGSVGSEVELDAVIDVAVDRRGNAYVLDKSAPFVRIINSKGILIATAGREGSGPGEFRRPRRLGWLGDTLWVYDPSLSRVTFLDGNGKLIRSQQFRAEVSPPIVQAELVALLPRGAVLAQGAVRSHDVSLNRAMRIPLFVTDASGKTVKIVTVLELQVRPLALRTRVNNRNAQMFVAQPFDDDPMMQVAQDGSAIIAIARRPESRWLAPAFRVTALSANGDTIFARYFRYRPRSLDERVFEGAISQLRAQLSRPGRKVEIVQDALRREIYRPEDVPPVAAAVVARNGDVWIRRESDVNETLVDHLVLNVQGKSAGVVKVSRAERVVGASKDIVWMVRTAEPGNQEMVAYRVMRSRD